MTLLPGWYAGKYLRTAEIDIVEMRGECCRIRYEVAARGSREAAIRLLADADYDKTDIAFCNNHLANFSAGECPVIFHMLAA